MKTRHQGKAKSRSRQSRTRGRTNVEGQNPKADDSPDKDLYHDENRRNMFDPEVAKALQVRGRSSGRKKRA